MSDCSRSRGTDRVDGRGGEKRQFGVGRVLTCGQRGME